MNSPSEDLCRSSALVKHRAGIQSVTPHVGRVFTNEVGAPLYGDYFRADQAFALSPLPDPYKEEAFSPYVTEFLEPNVVVIGEDHRAIWPKCAPSYEHDVSYGLIQGPEHFPTASVVVNRSPDAPFDSDLKQVLQRGAIQLALRRIVASIVNSSSGVKEGEVGMRMDVPAVLDEVASIGMLRDQIAAQAKGYEALDREARLERLRESAAALGRSEPVQLLASLADERGLSWQTISTMLDVSSSAIRKWRRGGSVAPENREQIAGLVAFFEQLEDVGEPIADIGSWMEMRVREDTTLTPAVIYRSGSEHRWLLLEWMRGYLDAAVMLDRFDGAWRERYARDPNFRVVEGAGGERAIVPR